MTTIGPRVRSINGRAWVMLDDRVMAETETEPTAADTTDAARAARQAVAAAQVRVTAGRWLTGERITVLGQQVVASINRYQQLHGKNPTWAEALAGVDPALLTPIQDIPADWPSRPALWRIELRQHLMTELRRTRWIAYQPTPRSLQPGDHGRGWLRAHPGKVTPTAT
jgi:hypothetical protein